MLQIKFLAIGAMGGTDASKLLYDRHRGADYVIFRSGNETPHQSNEHISQQMFFDFIDIYRKLFTDYFVSEPKA